MGGWLGHSRRVFPVDAPEDMDRVQSRLPVGWSPNGKAKGKPRSPHPIAINVNVGWLSTCMKSWVPNGVFVLTVCVEIC